jgi:hypothetical protein
MAITDLFDGDVSWEESWWLTSQLLIDPTSHLYAARAGWPYPASLEFRVLADLWDATVKIAAGKKHNQIKPYPRPWKRDDAPQRSKTSLPQHIIRKALADRGHGRKN